MIKDLVLWRLEKAEKTYDDGDLLFANDSYSSAVNRFYYAAFHAIRALLATKQMDSSKHSGVISLFNREFVKSWQMSKQASKTIVKVFNMRSDADYEDFVVLSKQDVLDVKMRVRLLIDEVSVFLKNYS